VLFHAERHTTQSNFNLTLSGFVSVKSQCVPRCGDGIVAGVEECDDGMNTGGYGGCTPDCSLGPRCGDRVTQGSAGEECDDGNRLDGDTCTADCQSKGPG
jgi:cysteine-rich repeat protein